MGKGPSESKHTAKQLSGQLKKEEISEDRINLKFIINFTSLTIN